MPFKPTTSVVEAPACVSSGKPCNSGEMIVTLPKAFPRGSWCDVVAVPTVGDAPLAQITKDFGISGECLHTWLEKADIEDGNHGAGPTKDESAELRDTR